MARKVTIGFAGDLSNAGRNEWFNLQPSAPTRVTSPIVTGEKYACKISGMTSGQREGGSARMVTTEVDSDTYHVRFFLRVETRPSADNVIFALSSTFSSIGDMRLRLKSTGFVEFMDSTTVLGTSASALTNDTWYDFSISLTRNTGTSDSVVVWKINGTTEYSSSTVSAGPSYREVTFGGNLNLEAQTQGIWYFASIIGNDSTSASENGIPDRASRITYSFVESGSTPTYNEPTVNGAASNVAAMRVDPPGDASTVYANCSSNSTSFGVSGSRFMAPCETCSVAGIGASDTIKGVGIGVLWASASAGASAVVPGVRMGGTNDYDMGPGTSITTTTPSFIDDSQIGANYSWQLVDPKDTTAWTVAKIDGMEIGFRASDSTPNARVVGLWACIEYVPVGSTPVAASVTSTLTATAASLTTAIRAAASVTSTATVSSAALTTAIRCASAVNAALSVTSASLAIPGAALAAAVTSTGAVAGAALTTAIRAAASVTSTATVAAAALTTAIRCASTLTSTAIVSAALTTEAVGSAVADVLVMVRAEATVIRVRAEATVSQMRAEARLIEV